MGTVVTVMNMKGGVGKTTVAAHLGYALAKFHLDGSVRKVLLIDYDPQFNLSQSLLPSELYYELEEKRKTCLAILQDDATALNPYELSTPDNECPPPPNALAHTVFEEAGGQLSIIPSTLDLMFLALGQTDKRTTVYEHRFATFIGQCRSAYDLTLIDCHPAGSILTKTSLQNSDHLLIPVMPNRYAVRGIALMLRFIKVSDRGGARPVPHILFNGAPRSTAWPDEVAIRGNAQFADLCMNSTLKYYRAFSTPLAGSDFCWSSKRPYCTEAFRNLLAVAVEFLQRARIGTTL